MPRGGVNMGSKKNAEQFFVRRFAFYAFKLKPQHWRGF
jgi:hypothetical protein